MVSCKRMAVTLSIVFGFILSTATVLAADPEFYGRIDSFSWKEYDTSGAELMHESGPIFTLGANWKNANSDLKNTTKFEVFGGAPTHYETAGSSKDNYYGFKIESDWAKPASNNGVEPFVGLGWKRWTRSVDTNPTAYIGYTENWSSLYTKAGINQDKGNFFWSAGIQYPLLNNNRVDLVSASFKPRNALGYFAEIGTGYKDCKISLTYDYQKYAASDVVNGYLQPLSKEQTFGLNITFKM